MLLIKNAEVLTPAPAGNLDLLLAGGRIEAMGRGLSLPGDLCQVLDAGGRYAVPGFIDSHVHFMGAGGEGGFRTRTPELPMSQAVQAGTTTLLGCLGTDGITRTLPALLAKARALEEEGLTTYIYTGSYGIPVRTFSSSIEEDIILIDKVIGVGEVAISDHRSSQPSLGEVARIAAEARRAGMLSGKAGVVNLHLGDGPRGLFLLREILATTELPPRQFLPTHMNRNRRLFLEGLDYAKSGGYVDFTTSSVPRFLDEGEVKCSRALKEALEAGVDVDHVSFSSDGQGSLPDFDGGGRLKGLGTGRVDTLFGEVRDAVLQEGLPLETALRVITSSPARLFKLHRKGALAPGKDADVVLLDPADLTVDTVVAGGRVLMRHKEALVKGTYE